MMTYRIRCTNGHVLNVAIQLISVYAYLSSGNPNAFYDSEPPILIEPGTTGQTLVFLNDTGLVVPCQASGGASTTWILANKLFDATELYSTTDLINSLNSQEISHDYHRTHLHRSTSTRLLNDELFVNINSPSNDKEQQEFIFRNLTAPLSQLKKRSIGKALNFNFQSNEQQVDWLNEHKFKLKELPGLRYIRADGALVFPPFASSFYSPSVHHTGYVCVAWNQAGTIVSAQINVKAVVNSQVFPVAVNDESTVVGGSAVFKCSIPSSEHTYARVEQWSINDALTINRDSLIEDRSKYVMLTTGELLVRHVTINDVQLKFNCHVRRLLNGELVTNRQPGKILLFANTNSAEGLDQLSVQLSKASNPRITFISPSIILEQFLETTNSLPEYVLHGTPIIGKPYNSHLHGHHRPSNSESLVLNLPSNTNLASVSHLNDLKLKRIVLACVSSLAKAQYSWLKNGQPIFLNDNLHQFDELLLIKLHQRSLNMINSETDISDLIGRFECRVSNFTNSTSEPLQELNRQLEIKATRRIRAKFLSNAQVIKAGQRAELNCTIEGLFTNVDWFKDGKPLLLNGNSHLFTSSSISHLNHMNHLNPTSIETDHSRSHLIMNNYSKLRESKHSNEELINNQKWPPSSSAILRLKNVRRSDSGIYQCISRDGSQSAEASIRLVVEDEVPRFLEVFTEHQLTIGSSLSLKCMASGNPLPQLTWYLDDIPLDSVSGAPGLLADGLSNINIPLEPSRNDIQSANSLLTNVGSSTNSIQNVASLANELNNVRIGDYVTSNGLVVSFVNISTLEESHGGLYRCSAYSELAIVSHQAEIRIQDAKLYVRSMRNQRLIASNDLRQRCPVTYSPDNLIEWYKGTNRLPANHRQVVYPNGTLFVGSVDKGDEGDYRCIVRNGKGEQAQSSFQLIIQVAPKIEPFQLPNNIQINQRLSITCTVIRGDAPLLLSWYKDGKLMNEKLAAELEFKLHQLEEFSSTLLFHRLRPEHRGNYTCVAKNSVAQDAYSQMMTIYEPPQWTHEPNDQTAIKGKRVWIACEAYGYPRPSIVWKVFDNSSAKYRTIVSSFHLQILDNGTLFIESVQKADSGNFLCQASNGIDTDLSKVVRLNVYEQAHFRIKFKSQTVQIGESVSLNCEAFGELPITLTWLKENTLITSDNASGRGNSIDLRHGNGSLQSTLTISDCQRRDSALYSCSARNQFGADHTSIQLIVQEPPDSPNELKLNEIKSRSATITWQLPFTGNARVEQMRLSLKELSTNSKSYLTDGIRNLTFSPLQNGQWTIGELQPYTNYSLTLTAINALGESPPSEQLVFQTEEEVPNESPKHIKAFPLSTKSIRITWNPPESRYNFGKIRGYYVGYKELHSSGPYIYKTISVDGQSANSDLKSNAVSANGVWQPSQFKAETIIKNLKRNVKYEIIIQPFNTKGGGTLSEKVHTQTFHEDAPKTPTITSTKVNYNSVTINWKFDSTDSQATGFKLQCTSVGNQVIEKTLHGADIDTFTFNKLQCGSKYEFSIQAYNSVGFSDKSQPILIKTNGSVPVAPSKDLLIQFLNASSVELNLASWKADICPIQRFSIKYRRRNEAIYTILSTNSQWSSSATSHIDASGNLIETNQLANSIAKISNHINNQNSHLPTVVDTAIPSNQFESDDLSVLNSFKSDSSSSMESDGRLLIDSLQAQNWYELKISAFTEAGNTESDYSFFTHSVDKSSRPSISMAYDSSLYSVLMEFEVLVPLCLSVIVVIAVLILLYMVVTKRTLNRANGLYDHHGTIVDPLTGCVTQQNKTNPFPTLQATKLHDGLSLVNIDSPNKLTMDCNLPEDCCTATTNTNSSNNSPAMSSISSNQQPHCYLQQQSHCQFYADAIQTLQHNQSNYYPCPYASVQINENGNSFSQQSACSTLPNNNIYLKQLCEFSNPQCNQIAAVAAAQFHSNQTLAQNLNNLNSLPNLTNLTTARKHLLDECQYATVKRTARKPIDRSNIYDYPVKSSHVTITENLFEDAHQD